MAFAASAPARSPDSQRHVPLTRHHVMPTPAPSQPDGGSPNGMPRQSRRWLAGSLALHLTYLRPLRHCVGATLTPDDIAIGRASAAVVRLDAMIEAMRRDGTLQEFNARYKRGRAAALAEG